jgi:drug/metabolite transporter (DMT)-like permease
MTSVAVALAVAAALLFGTADFLAGQAARDRRPRSVALTVIATSTAVLAVWVALTGFDRTGTDHLLAIGAGISGGLGYIAYYTALSTGPMGTVTTLTATTTAALPLAVGLLIGERLTPAAILGAALAIAAIPLLLAPRHPRASTSHRRAPAQLLALLAGAGFGGFFILIGSSTNTITPWPLLLAGIASTTIIASFTRFDAPHAAARRRPSVRAIVAGITDTAGTVAFLAATQRGLLSLVAVIAALSPLPTAILAKALLREAITPPQTAGIAIALTGISVITLASS